MILIQRLFSDGNNLLSVEVLYKLTWSRPHIIPCDDRTITSTPNVEVVLSFGLQFRFEAWKFRCEFSVHVCRDQMRKMKH
jgi:hypothetical protein